MVIGKAKPDRKKQITMIIVINKKIQNWCGLLYGRWREGGILEYRREEQKRVAKKEKTRQKKQKKDKRLMVCVRHDACLLGEKKGDAYAPACTLGGSLNFTESRDWTKRRRGGDVR